MRILKEILKWFPILYINRKQENSLVLPRRWGKLLFWEIPTTRFSIMDLVEIKSLSWSGYQRNKMTNPFSCILTSFMKYPIKNNLCNTAERSEVFCYTPQLSDRKDEANKTNESNSNKQPYVPFVGINIKTFGEGFKSNDLLSDNEEKRLLSHSCVKKVMRCRIKNNKKQIDSNLDNVVRHLPNDRVFTVFGKKYNDYSSLRFVLN